MGNQNTIDAINKLEEAMYAACPPGDFPLTHIFTPGLYTREIFMPKGSLITSKTHNTTHPFFILQGSAEVWTEEGGVQILEAPYRGITTPGTTRVLLILEDCIWITTHPIASITGEENNLSEEDKLKVVQGIEDIIIEKRTNPLLYKKEEELCHGYQQE